MNELERLRADVERLTTTLEDLTTVANRVVLTVPERDNAHHGELSRATGLAIATLATLAALAETKPAVCATCSGFKVIDVEDETSRGDVPCPDCAPTPETDKTKRAKRYAANAITVSLDGSDDLRADVVKIRDRLWEESKHATTPEPHPEYLRGQQDGMNEAWSLLTQRSVFLGLDGIDYRDLQSEFATRVRALATGKK